MSIHLKIKYWPKGQKSDDAYNNFFNKDVSKTCFFLNKEILFEKNTEDRHSVI